MSDELPPNTRTKRPKETVIIDLQPIDDRHHFGIIPEPSHETPEEISFWERYGGAILLVLLPTVLSVIYLVFFETDQYKVESQFVIRVVGSGASGGPMNLLGSSANYARSDEDAYAVNSYLKSRDIVHEMSGKLETYFGRDSIDPLHRFPPLIGKPSMEELFEIYLSHIRLSMDGNGINKLEVFAYTPWDALEFNTALLQQSERLVNRLNARAEEESFQAARRMVDEAQDRLAEAQTALLEFRNRELIVDPGKQGLADLELVSQLAGKLAQEQASISQLLIEAPSSPQVRQRKERAEALQAQIDLQRSKIVGGQQALVPKLAEFEGLSLRRELATKTLASALDSLEVVKHDSRMQRFFLETIVSPVLPDKVFYPRRFLLVLSVFVASLVVFWVVRKTLQIVAEHQA